MLQDELTKQRRDVLEEKNKLQRKLWRTEKIVMKKVEIITQMKAEIATLKADNDRFKQTRTYLSSSKKRGASKKKKKKPKIKDSVEKMEVTTPMPMNGIDLMKAMTAWSW